MSADLGIVKLLLLASSKIDLVFARCEFIRFINEYLPCSYFLWDDEFFGIDTLMQKMGAVFQFYAAIAEAGLVAALANVRQKRRLDTGCQHRVVVGWN